MKQAQISAGGSEKTQRCVETVQKPRMKSTKMHYKRQGSARTRRPFAEMYQKKWREDRYIGGKTIGAL